jgi:hypothetical protein
MWQYGDGFPGDTGNYGGGYPTSTTVLQPQQTFSGWGAVPQPYVPSQQFFVPQYQPQPFQQYPVYPPQQHNPGWGVVMQPYVPQQPSLQHSVYPPPQQHNPVQLMDDTLAEDDLDDLLPPSSSQGQPPLQSGRDPIPPAFSPPESSGTWSWRPSFSLKDPWRNPFRRNSGIPEPAANLAPLQPAALPQPVANLAPPQPVAANVAHIPPAPPQPDPQAELRKKIVDVHADIKGGLDYYAENFKWWLTEPAETQAGYQWYQTQLEIFRDIEVRVNYHLNELRKPLPQGMQAHHLEQLGTLKLALDEDLSKNDAQAQQRQLINGHDFGSAYPPAANAGPRSSINLDPIKLPEPSQDQLDDAQEKLVELLDAYEVELNNLGNWGDTSGLVKKYAGYQQLLNQQLSWWNKFGREARETLNDLTSRYKEQVARLNERVEDEENQIIITPPPASPAPYRPIAPLPRPNPLDLGHDDDADEFVVRQKGAPPVHGFRAAPGRVSLHGNPRLMAAIEHNFPGYMPQNLGDRTQITHPDKPGVQVDIGSDWATIKVPRDLPNSAAVRNEVTEKTLKSLIEIVGKNIIVTINPLSIESYQYQKEFLLRKGITFEVGNDKPEVRAQILLHDPQAAHLQGPGAGPVAPAPLRAIPPHIPLVPNAPPPEQPPLGGNPLVGGAPPAGGAPPPRVEPSAPPPPDDGDDNPEEGGNPGMVPRR